MSSVPNVIARAKDVLKKANEFTGSVVKQSGGTKNAFAKPPQRAAESAAAPSHYSVARSARKEPGEFMGIRSDQAAELKSAEAARGQMSEALKAAGQ